MTLEIGGSVKNLLRNLFGLSVMAIGGIFLQIGFASMTRDKQASYANRLIKEIEEILR